MVERRNPSMNYKYSVDLMEKKYIHSVTYSNELYDYRIRFRMAFVSPMVMKISLEFHNNDIWNFLFEEKDAEKKNIASYRVPNRRVFNPRKTE